MGAFTLAYLSLSFSYNSSLQLERSAGAVSVAQAVRFGIHQIRLAQLGKIERASRVPLCASEGWQRVKMRTSLTFNGHSRYIS